MCQTWECLRLITKLLTERKKIVEHLDKYAYMRDHTMIRYIFGTRAYRVSVILLSDMPPALSFAFLSFFVRSLNYFTLPTKTSSLLSYMLQKCTCRQIPVRDIFLLPFFC